MTWFVLYARNVSDEAGSVSLDYLAFVDLETTGANPVRDRITEIGLVVVEGDRVTRWSTLINPGCRIPPFIQRLTGITQEMVAGAPSFADVADEIQSRLASLTFIAHNARFDYGFLKNEFKRLGRRFQPNVVCTVKLSRRLFPAFPKHNLDSLIERYGLTVTERHRALDDAELIWQFWQKLYVAPGAEALATAIQHQLARPSLPPHLDPARCRFSRPVQSTTLPRFQYKSARCVRPVLASAALRA